VATPSKTNYPNFTGMLLEIPFIHYSSLVIFFIIALIVTASTFIPFIPSKKWYIRMMDFPRLQTFFIALVALVWYLYFHYWKGTADYIIIGLLIIAIIIQAYKAFPYTPLGKKEVKWADKDADDSNSISFFICNVRQKNNEYQRVIDRIMEYDADIIITTESNKAWGNKLAAIKDRYPHQVEIPQENAYGMHLYSKLPLQHQEVRHLVEPDIPSIKTTVQLPNDAIIELFVVHPRPPFPTEDDDSKDRDAELVMVGKDARKSKGAVIVAGDFNDVAWSATTRLFQEVSGLLDPRRGRGFYNTFHAQWPVFRWPLDHIFHSTDFQLLQIEKAGKVGSDHFPMYVKLRYAPEQKEEQQSVQKDEDTDEKAAETIEEEKNE
jgi:endonuclease/exonuclease/phosphatase (EEP) superfamily protein YafD